MFVGNADIVGKDTKDIDVFKSSVAKDIVFIVDNVEFFCDVNTERKLVSANRFTTSSIFPNNSVLITALILDEVPLEPTEENGTLNAFESILEAAPTTDVGCIDGCADG